MVSSIIWDIPESERNKIRNRGQLSEHRGIAKESSVLAPRRLDSHENRSYKMAGRPKKKPEYNPELQ